MRLVRFQLNVCTFKAAGRELRVTNKQSNDFIISKSSSSYVSVFSLEEEELTEEP